VPAAIAAAVAAAGGPAPGKRDRVLLEVCGYDSMADVLGAAATGKVLITEQ